MSPADLRALLIDASILGVAPRLDAAIWIEGELREISSSDGAPAVFDLASLTKPLATGLVALSLAAEGKLGFDSVGAPGSDGVTPRQLLDHSAGYAEWLPLFRESLSDPLAARIFERTSDAASSREAFARSRELMTRSVAAVSPERPAGSRTLYSDVGFLKLQPLLETAGGEDLARLFARRVVGPLHVDLRFVDLARGDSCDAMPTGTLRPRPPAKGQQDALADLATTDVGLARGQVDDDNAFALGGVAGHAGLFGTAAAVALAGAGFLEECEGRGRLAPAALARELCGPSGPGARGLGWDRPSAQSSLGTILGRGALGAVGHLGFTGTSLWIDRDRRAVVALCTNRVLRGRENEQIRDFRRTFHDAVARTFGLD